MPPSCLLWLLSGVAAGGAAAAVLVKRLQTRAAANGRQLGVDVTAIVGALAGVGCGLVFTLLQLPAGGDLGSVRLTSLGARMSALLVMAPSTMGLAGMATGAVLGWRAGRSDWQSVRSAEAPAPSLNPADGPVPAVATPGEAADEAEVPTTVVEDRSKLAERDR